MTKKSGDQPFSCNVVEITASQKLWSYACVHMFNSRECDLFCISVIHLEAWHVWLYLLRYRLFPLIVSQVFMYVLTCAYEQQGAHKVESFLPTLLGYFCTSPISLSSSSQGVQTASFVHQLVILPWWIKQYIYMSQNGISDIFTCVHTIWAELHNHFDHLQVHNYELSTLFDTAIP